ncbi:MAG: peroxidase family protein, partial [Candidatus Promineifilaceae bacterium]
GFGFSESAFHIAIVMASRRLKSDRFFTTNFNEETYTRAGMDWIRENSMRTVLLRHYPELEAALHGLGSAFNPWNPTVPAQ